ncbi:MAG TPA: DUF488 family protein [Vicinamibacterales bacterium]|nr:DUF488 family protein [Vicinamibacterales bacterium]
MAFRSVQLGSPRQRGEGIRLGTVRHPPRGVRKADYARGNHFDLWLPELAPSAALVSWIKAKPITPSRWATFVRRYRREMAKPPASRLIALLAALSRHANFSIGCYCDDASHCHRTVLEELLAGTLKGDSHS